MPTRLAAAVLRAPRRKFENMTGLAPRVTAVVQVVRFTSICRCDDVGHVDAKVPAYASWWWWLV